MALTLKWGLVVRTINPTIRGLELLVPPPEVREGRGAGGDLIDNADVIQPPSPSHRTRLRGCPGGWAQEVLGECSAWGRHQSSVLCFMHLFHPASPAFILFYNKLVL